MYSVSPRRRSAACFVNNFAYMCVSLSLKYTVSLSLSVVYMRERVGLVVVYISSKSKQKCAELDGKENNVCIYTIVFDESMMGGWVCRLTLYLLGR